MILHKAHQTIADYNMLKKGDKVLIGVSGGPDSMALLHTLNGLRKEFKLKLFVGHLNHMIRKGDAEKDSIFVKKAAERLGLPFEIGSRDVPKVAKDSKLSIEEAARFERYKFLLEAARRFGANKIALAHTADDQAETVLMRLIRGAGLLGLSGIPPTRNIDDITIIRPFIEVSKDEILKFLSERKIPFRQDATNLKPMYLRNRIRHRLIPFLEKGFNTNIGKVLREIGKNLRIDYDYLLKISGKLFKRYATRKNGGVVINLKFLNEDTAIQRMIVRETIKKVKGNLDAVSYSHWEDLNELLTDTKKRYWSLTLPDNIWVKKEGGNLVFERGVQEKQDNFKKVLYRLEVPGTVKIPEINKVIEAGFVKNIPDFKLKKSKTMEWFDYEKLKLPLFIRFRKEGDKIKPLGMGKYKRLKRLFIDEKVPVERRKRTSLVVSGGKIIWVCGVKRAQEARITEGTKKVLRLRIRSSVTDTT